MGHDNRDKIWEKSEVEDFLSKIEYSYQKIRLPYGLSTEGDERNWLLNLAFGDNLEGKTVLDIGSYLGHFCLQACERGADHVVGIEVDPLRIQKARTIAEIKDLTPEYRVGDFEEMDIKEKFDIVLCLNLLHHLYNPIGVLHKIARMSRQTLILEVATFGKHDGLKFEIPLWLKRHLKRQSVILVRPGVSTEGKRSDSQKYFFSEKSLVNILENHTKLFSKVEVFPSRFKNRIVIKATRRKIGHLVIVSGPTSSGKSSFIEGLKDDSSYWKNHDMLPQNILKWPHVGASKFFKRRKTADADLFTAEYMEGLILHYDILRPYTSGMHDYFRDQALDLMDCADKITVITLKAPKEKLIEQLVGNELFNASESWGNGNDRSKRKRKKTKKNISGFHLLWKIKNNAKKLIFRRRKKKNKGNQSHHRKIYLNYQDGEWIDSWYQRWNSFLDKRRPDAHKIIATPVSDKTFEWILTDDNN